MLLVSPDGKVFFFFFFGQLHEGVPIPMGRLVFVTESVGLEVISYIHGKLEEDIWQKNGQLLVILTKVWVLPTQNSGQNMYF